MKKIIDLSGQVFNGITVFKYAFCKDGVHFWECICHCGKHFIRSRSNIKSKKKTGIASCGCSLGGKGLSKNTKDNVFEIQDNVLVVKCTNNKEFIADIEDEAILKNYCWRVDKNGYAVANSRDCNNRIVFAHKIIFDSYYGKTDFVDHASRNKQDNRKVNLRKCEKWQNNCNIKIKNNNTSGKTGVTYNKNSKKWIARISRENIRYFIGSYTTKEEAIEARKIAENTFHGEFKGEAQEETTQN